MPEAADPKSRPPGGEARTSHGGDGRSGDQSRLPFSNARSRRPEGPDTISGEVERVTFHSEETGFCVLRVRLRERRGLTTVVGHLPRVTAGEHVRAEGYWTTDPRYGPQFRAEELGVSAPNTREGIERYLASGSIVGIGPKLAGRLVEAFGESVFDVIDQTPERLEEVSGVGATRARRIVADWAAQRRVREIMVFLHSHGVGTARAVRIHRTYGSEAISLIRADPYCLARDIRGIGFATADALARSLGIEREAPSRVRSGIRHVLGEALGEGHCGLPNDEAQARAEALLDVGPAHVEKGLLAELETGEIVQTAVDGRDCVFLSGLYRTEQRAARCLLDLAAGAPPWPMIDPARALPWVEGQLGLTLAASQREAVAGALTAKVLCLTGGPGVGKTTLVNAILRILGAKGVRTLLAAPTGRAAKRLSEATGLEARTIHRLLEASPRGGFKRSESHPLDCDLLVLDETSMVDVSLLAATLRAVPRQAALLLVGDVDQLPSVGPGQVLADVIDSGVVPVVRLREVFRQAAESRIVRNAHRINRGEMPELARGSEEDFFFVNADEPEAALERLVDVVRSRIPARFGLDPMRDVQVLCPMHRGTLGARNVNEALQRALNPASRAEGALHRFGWIYAAGDKVMQIENDYEKDVYNGDVGIVSSLDLDTREIAVDFDGRLVTYDFDELDRLVLAYAITVHKSQGSEYPAVVIPVSTQHYPMLKRNLVYTGVTRGKRLVVLVGQRRALAIAVRGAGEGRRWSKLRDWLAGEPF